MFGWVKKILGGNNNKKNAASLDVLRARQREMLKAGKPEDVAALAGGVDTDPEILYYLAKNDNPSVRRAVATNKATPVQASTLLANDRDIDVRYALAARLVE